MGIRWTQILPASLAALLSIAEQPATAQITNWNYRPGWGSAQAYSIAYGNGFYLAPVSTTSYLVSSNGSDWTLRLYTISPTNYAKLRFMAGQFFLLSNPILSSSDGLNWYPHPAPSLPSAMAYGGGRYVIVGSQPPSIAYSTNATDWTPATTTSLALSDVAFGAGVFVACGGGGILTSTDGAHWFYPTNQTILNSVCYGGGTFLVAGGTTFYPALYRSTDGYAWSVTSTNDYFANVFWGLGNFVAFNGNYVSLTSTDSLNWTTFTQPTATLADCTFSASTCYIIGNNGLFAESNPLIAPAFSPSNLQATLYPGIEITGNIGSHYRIEYSDTIPQTNWTTATELYLQKNPTLWVAPQVANGRRFYRSVRLD